MTGFADKGALAALVDRAIDEAYLAASAAATAYVDMLSAQVLSAAGPDVDRTTPAYRWLAARAAAGDAATTAAILEPHAAIVGASLPLIDHVAAGYPAFLRGQRSAQAILFKGPGLVLWEAYFSPANGLHDIHNQLAAAGLARVWRSRPSPRRVLELGAGTGGTSHALYRALDGLDGGDRAELTISDVAPSLLLRTMERYGLDPSRVQRRKLDFESEFEAQGVPGGIDVIVATNALHNARDLAGTLQRCRRALAPGGALILSESLCGADGAVHQDFVFNLLPRVAPPPDGLAGSRFMTGAAWRALLAANGFAVEAAINSNGPELAILALGRLS
jgi:SAM-dependent methyltransferase